MSDLRLAVQEIPPAGFADPTHRASFGFVTNYLIVGKQEHARWKTLVGEVRAVLEQG